MKIYLAAPLFSLAEKEFNQNIADEIKKTRPEFTILLPQNHSKNVVDDDREKFKKLFDCCIELIDKCDIVISILDGADADSGTCIELGYAYSNGKPIIGVRTDFRSLEEKGVNLMVSNVCTEYILKTQIDNLEFLADEIIASIDNLRI